MEQISFNEIVALFLSVSIYEIKNETETPNINFIFGPDGLVLFNKLINNPIIKDNLEPLIITKENKDFLEYRNNDDCPTLYIKDSIKFFELLTKITNSQIELYNYYGIKSLPREMAKHILRRIWLRMSVNDIENVEMFLERQLEFVNNRSFDYLKKEKITTYLDYDVNVETIANRTFDETTRNMVFTIENDKEHYELPNILYEVDDNNTFYIYGVQNKITDKSKTIERKLYKLNKGIENPNVHPSKVCALLILFEQLKKRGITNIVVPGMQVLSYRYHELLSIGIVNDLQRVKDRLMELPNSLSLKREYNSLKEWYKRLNGKEDTISYLKTEELFNLIYRMTKHDSSIKITNEVNIEGDSINIKI